MEIDRSLTEAVDAVLTTTRAERRRLDLERHVDDEIILDCIDVAEQPPAATQGAGDGSSCATRNSSSAWPGCIETRSAIA